MMLCDLNRRHVLAAVTAVILLGIFYPSRPEELLRVSPFPNSLRRGVLEYVKTGRSATVTTFDDHGAYSFSTNGLPEAGTAPKGSLVSSTSTATWLGLLPALIHPKTDSMLVVGFGSGVAASSPPRSVSSIDVFELEEGIIEANRLVGAKRMDDPLSDPRLRLILNDGRNGLSLTNKTYDAIVSQPSHPWTAGASHLYTREFAALVHDHLAEDGVFIQWMDTGFLDAELLRSLGATLLDVFPSVYLFQPNDTSLLFCASKQPWQIKPGLPEFSNRADREELMKMGLQSPLDLISLMSIDDDGLKRMCKGATITTDNNNLLALRMILTSGDEKTGLSVRDLINEYDPLCHSPSADSPYEGIDRGYIALRRNRNGRIKNAEAIIRSIPRHEDQLLARAQIHLSNGESDEALQKLESILATDPRHPGAWFQIFVVSTIDPRFDIYKYPISKIRSHLSPAHQDVIDAFEKLKVGELEGMDRLDERLETLNPDDPAYLVSNLLRIDWRLKDGTAGSRRERGSQSLELIDRILPYTVASKIVMYRLNAAVLAGRPNVAVTTAQLIASKTAEINNADVEDTFANEAPEDLIKYLQHCLAVIEPLQGDRRVEQMRLFGVRYFVAQTLESLVNRSSANSSASTAEPDR